MIIPLGLSEIIRFNIVILLLILSGCTSPLEKVTESAYPDGTPRIVKTYRMVKGTRVLVHESTFYPDGKMQLDGGYEDGERHGQWVFYYQNGQKWSEALYDKGKEYDLKTVWFENGNKYFEGEMKQGERVGIWRFWDETGSLVKEIDYDTIGQ
jgi:antitoxin component YwqK of YwqJK toxin-antitoxin module